MSHHVLAFNACLEQSQGHLVELTHNFQLRFATNCIHSVPGYQAANAKCQCQCRECMSMLVMLCGQQSLRTSLFETPRQAHMQNKTPRTIASLAAVILSFSSLGSGTLTFGRWDCAGCCAGPPSLQVTLLLRPCARSAASWAALNAVASMFKSRTCCLS